MKINNHASIGLTIVCVFLGAITGVQLKSVKSQVPTTDMQRASELSVELKKLQDENNALSQRLTESQAKNVEYEQSIANENNSYKLLMEDLEKVRMYGGLLEVKGRGVQVTLDDSRKKNDNADQNLFLVHAEDILSVINELNVAGAEAISINGQRIVGSSSVRCAGSIVNVNGNRIAAPFIINAIGDPDILESALKFPGGVIDTLAPWGIEITIKKYNEIIVPAYIQTTPFKEAVPVAKESGV